MDDKFIQALLWRDPNTFRVDWVTAEAIVGTILDEWTVVTPYPHFVATERIHKGVRKMRVEWVS